MQIIQERFEHEYSSDLKTNLCDFLKVTMKVMLNNEIELKMKYLEGRRVLMKKIMKKHFRSE